jgi:threonine synthase
MSSERIRYYSTNMKSEAVSFSEALIKGLAPDGGLYMPSLIPVLDYEELVKLSDQSYPEIAYTVLNRIIGNEIESEELRSICSGAYDFEVPLEHVTERKYILRLDQGPTASFKDFAARMMSRLMQYFISKNSQNLTILTATSGDTGSAVASAYYGLENIKVIILYPIEEVSAMQRKQMTTLGKNITVIGINGKFDDCQQLVKTAFTDSTLNHLPLSSANSINTGRLLPQSVYYFYAWSRLSKNPEEKILFSVPSGNFGNLMGGLIAGKMGLPVKRFIVSTNANGEVPEFLGTGIYKPVDPSINCISSAMNVGHPSNLARIVALYGGVMDQNGKILKAPDMALLRQHIAGISISDIDTIKTIKECFTSYGILLEPHGAVAWKGLTEYLKDFRETSEQLSVSLETAHPAKFPEEIMKITGKNPVLPVSLSGLENKDESYIRLENSYEKLKGILVNYQ